MIHKIWANRIYIAKLAVKYTVSVFSLLGIISTFTPLDDLFPDKYSHLRKIFLSALIVVVVWLVFYIICALFFAKKKKIEIFKANDNHHVYAQYGDVFSEDVVNNQEERKIIVIPVNRCFDTVVDNDLISSKTLHGATLKRLYASGTYSETSLNEAIQHDLIDRQQLTSRQLAPKEKRKGNLKRYDVGVVSEIHGNGHNTFFLMALSTFDEKLTAHTTQEEYVVAMQRLIEYCNSRSQGYPIVIPLIGAGLSRTQCDERSILEYIVKLLKMNRNLITSDIHIVVRDSERGTIPISEL